MSTKDKRILSPNGGRYPFKVSDEYFDHLTARIMKRIDTEKSEEHEKTEKLSQYQLAKVPHPVSKQAQIVDISMRHRNQWLKITSIAASLLLITIVTTKFVSSSYTSATPKTLTTEYTDDDYNEELMSYTMADNIAVYDYLSNYEEEE